MSNSDVANPSSGDLLLIVLAILLPPVAVLIRKGFSGTFLLNVLFTILGFIPGLIHAVWVVARS